MSVTLLQFIESRFVVVGGIELRLMVVGGINIYILAGGQVVLSHDPVSRYPLSAQVGDRHVAAITFLSLCCNLYGLM